MERYGSKPDHYAWIGWKNHKHSVNNPYAQFQTEYTLEEIKDARMIHEPLTKLQCSPTSDGAACAIVASRALRRRARPVATGRSRSPARRWSPTSRSTFDGRTRRSRIVGCDMSQAAPRAGLRGGRVGPDDVDVVELHDCFSRERADHLRGARARRGGRGPRARRRARRRPTAATAGRQPVRRPDLQGPSARGDRARAVLGAHLAAARRAPTSARSTARRSRCSTTSASAAPRSSRSTSPRPRQGDTMSTTVAPI